MSKFQHRTGKRYFKLKGGRSKNIKSSSIGIDCDCYAYHYLCLEITKLNPHGMPEGLVYFVNSFTGSLVQNNLKKTFKITKKLLKESRHKEAPIKTLLANFVEVSNFEQRLTKK